MKDKLKFIATIFGLISAVIGGYLFTENWMNVIALEVVTPVAATVAELDKRLTLTELKELHRKILDEYYYWKGLSKKYPEDKEIQKQLTKVKKRLAEIENRIKELEEAKK